MCQDRITAKVINSAICLFTRLLETINIAKAARRGNPTSGRVHIAMAGVAVVSLPLSAVETNCRGRVRAPLLQLQLQWSLLTCSCGRPPEDPRGGSAWRIVAVAAAAICELAVLKHTCVTRLCNSFVEQHGAGFRICNGARGRPPLRLRLTRANQH